MAATRTSNLPVPKTPYMKGMDAFVAGEPADTNPYKRGEAKTRSSSGWNQKRVEFFDGYFDARIRHRFGPIFRKYGITW